MWLNTRLQATAQQGVENTIVFRPAVVVREQIVFAPKGDGADGILHGIIVYVKISFFTIAADTRPHAKSIANGLSKWTIRGKPIIQPAFHLL
jgi:hypothetical protein